MNRAGPSRSKLGTSQRQQQHANHARKTPQNRKRTLSMMTAERERDSSTSVAREAQNTQSSSLYVSTTVCTYLPRNTRRLLLVVHRKCALWNLKLPMWVSYSGFLRQFKCQSKMGSLNFYDRSSHWLVRADKCLPFPPNSTYIRTTSTQRLLFSRA
jgi:hypothetical protein